MPNYFKVNIALGVLVIMGTGLWLYSRYEVIKANLIEKEKVATAAYIRGHASALVKPEDFTNKDPVHHQKVFQSFFEAIQSPELVRMKVWDRNFTILWANIGGLAGERFPDNHEVKEALEGEVEFEIEKPKDEHVSERQFQQLSETYVPIPNAKGEIVGVIEVYQPVLSLNKEIKAQFQKLAFRDIAMALVGYCVTGFFIYLFLRPGRIKQN